MFIEWIVGAARNYAETNATTTEQVAQRPEGFNPWAAFFFGYMLGGMGESPAYHNYRTTTNTYYRDNYIPPTPPQDSGNWGDSSDSVDNTAGWGSGWSWSDDAGSWGDDTGSWGSDSWGSSDSGSWGSSWDSYDSGSSWGSSDSGSWGSDWGSSGSGSWGD